MREHKVRFLEAPDVDTFVEWFNRTPNNLRDPDILNYPTLKTVCAYDESGPSAYLPMQLGLVLESLAVKPELSPIQAAAAFKDLVKAAELVASSQGIRELYFACSDEGVIKMAERHGFEALPWKVLRMRLK